jgi:hypothetical protein
VRSNSYWLPFIRDGSDDMILHLRNHAICTCGMQLILNVGYKRLASIWKASLLTSVLPSHKATGKVNVNAVQNDEQWFPPLIFEYLLNLGEVRATCIVATLVDGEQGHSNCKDMVDMIYLPILMGYRMCYVHVCAGV